jgi:hypothetical protein
MSNEGSPPARRVAEELEIEEPISPALAPRASNLPSPEVVEHVTNVAPRVTREAARLGAKQLEVLRKRKQAPLTLETPLNPLRQLAEVVQISRVSHGYEA